MEERNSQCKHISHFFFSKFWNPYFRPSHITIWLGDLNYRLQGIDTYPARSLIKQNLHRVISSPILSSLSPFNSTLHIFMSERTIVFNLIWIFSHVINSLFGYFSGCMAKINSYRKLVEDKFSTVFVREHWISSQLISTIKEVAIMIQVIRWVTLFNSTSIRHAWLDYVWFLLSRQHV